jgi:hypothetical protein
VAGTTGRQLFAGTIVASGESGSRSVVNSVIFARGAFTGIGRIVEVENRPGDPENVSRDDLVFPQGRIHIVNTNRSVSQSVNPQTCAFTARVRQTTRVRGGTGRFRRASGRFSGTVRAWGVATRNADGTCSQTATLLLEVDVLPPARFTLSY